MHRLKPLFRHVVTHTRATESVMYEAVEHMLRLFQPNTTSPHAELELGIESVLLRTAVAVDNGADDVIESWQR